MRPAEVSVLAPDFFELRAEPAQLVTAPLNFGRERVYVRLQLPHCLALLLRHTLRRWRIGMNRYIFISAIYTEYKMHIKKRNEKRNSLLSLLSNCAGSGVCVCVGGGLPEFI
mmetsp:Transcript_20892/g.52980  ORF Transcript_20892/g.52980 Transcript_20892/m.52980 type:complete len:112 (+) Transcript_20892:542-877(+)